MAAYSDRTVPPSETLARTAPLLANFGITRVARHTGLDNIGIPVWCAYVPNGRSIAIAQGKGLTDDDAKASAVMEALERVVANRPAIATLCASANDLREEGFSFDTLACLIGRHEDDIRLDEQIDWALGKDLLTDRDVYVPFEAALLDRTRRNRFWMSSDGLASGNTMEEATLHGLLERVERDAFCLWQVGAVEDRLSRCIDPASFEDPWLDDLVRKIEAAGLVVRLFDMTSDIAVPCFTTVLGPAERRGDNIRFVEVTGGSGAHPSPVRAAIRAITEAVQSRITFISGARDDLSPDEFQRPVPAETLHALDAIPVAWIAAARYDDKPHLNRILDALRERQIAPVIALPLSDPALPFHVVKVFVPSLENPEGARARRFGARAIAKALFS
ncbi:YcaO-like family protein [Rhizobium sp. 57MFTsu3.2]|uniref:YcaO-like family protein n=1 Tax=Rhizobium sp. 57MFTsu3.2 TaxID=1048681 RepID=UPI001AED57EC|nr:YcaO-like family protein [Rhizobium sp. 57MFTsu3.2]